MTERVGPRHTRRVLNGTEVNMDAQFRAMENEDKGFLTPGEHFRSETALRPQRDMCHLMNALDQLQDLAREGKDITQLKNKILEEIKHYHEKRGSHSPTKR